MNGGKRWVDVSRYAGARGEVRVVKDAAPSDPRQWVYWERLSCQSRRTLSRPLLAEAPQRCEGGHERITMTGTHVADDAEKVKCRGSWVSRRRPPLSDWLRDTATIMEQSPVLSVSIPRFSGLPSARSFVVRSQALYFRG